MFKLLNRFKSWYVDTYQNSWNQPEMIAMTCLIILGIVSACILAVAVPIVGLVLIGFCVVVAVFFAWVFEGG
jgi:uncharacterized membrane protein